ncbi:alpha/beta fold hydrolase [Urechidicola vernalis]|uniref:Alpha/beta hydrolase n=1 Tax=Urechidicola vernalis TaxID=3075600 RepID=A0ABU2Y5C6_9FLAO|nr:alpha/beta hydrolase [Urechidicola sp. P050]MDT0553381.1 alpha/beta hydrolase [Urechidicola sp. P050]
MSRFFEYNNIQVQYESTGKGPAIVLLHGFLENLGMWEFLIPQISKKNKVISIDLLGHGKTGNLGYVHTMEDHAKLIRELLKSLNIRKATLIGHSMGGYIALAFADLYPKNTKGFCLLNSTAFADSSAKKVSRERAIKAVKENHKTFIRVSIPMLFSKHNRRHLKKQINEVTSEALKTSKQGIIASLEGMKIREERIELLQNETFKKMLILGINDTVLDIRIHKNQVKNTTTKFIELRDGHMSHIETTNDVVNILSTFC